MPSFLLPLSSRAARCWKIVSPGVIKSDTCVQSFCAHRNDFFVACDRCMMHDGEDTAIAFLFLFLLLLLDTSIKIMFSLASGIYQSYFVPQQLNILLIGEEGTGKTTLLERIKATQTSRRVPSTKARAILACPAPKKYSPSLHQEEDVVEEE